MRNRRRLLVLATAVALMTPTATATAAEPPGAAANPLAASADEVLVRYRADSTAAERARVKRDHDLTTVRASRDGRTEVVIAQGRSPATARRALKSDPLVVAVAPNHRRELADDTTEEPFFAYEWGLHNTAQTITVGNTSKKGVADVDIDGLEALRITIGADDVVVAVIDDGIDFNHPDLADRAWTNPGEAGDLAANGIDDDVNGFIDDVNGWDFCNDDNSVSDPGEDFHGTHVAGTIAASRNGTGIVGVAPGVRLMALKFIDDSRVCGSDEMAVAAIDYAASFGVPVINASWGGPDPSELLDWAIGESGALFVAAAGNVGSNMDGGGAIFYPAASIEPNVVTVAAIDQTGRLASFSNYGSTSVDLSAPGTNILSAITPRGICDPCWAWLDGTSMAAPHVSGVAALVASVLPGDQTPAQLRQRLLDGGVNLALTSGKTVTGRLVNALRAIDRTPPVATAIDRHGFNVGSVLGSNKISTTMTWPAATDDLSGIRDYRVLRSANGGAYGTIVSATTTRAAKWDFAFGTGYRFRLRAQDRAGHYSASVDGPIVKATLFQDGTASAKYAGRWSVVASSVASNGRLHRSTRGGAVVTFTKTARAISVVGRQGPTNGRARVYVDGVYRTTINLFRRSSRSKVVVFNASWPATGAHTVKVVVVGTAGHPGVEVDAFAILR